MSRTFVALPQVREVGLHPAYNAWHQLDHLPQNRALPGVAHGERWVRTPALRDDATPAASPLSAVDYFAMYWFREPVEQSVQEWLRLGNSTLEEGRRPDLQWIDRPLVGFFEPLRGYPGHGTPITATALPFHPAAEIGVRAVLFDDPHAEAAAAWYQWEHQHRLRRLGSNPEVVGSWTFTSLRVDLAGRERPRKRAIHLSLTWVHESAQTNPLHDAGLDEEPNAGELLLDTRFATIAPWRWDWFA